MPKKTPQEMTQETLLNLAAQASGAATGALMVTKLNTSPLAEVIGDGSALVGEVLRRALLVNLVDQALNHIEPGKDLRPIVTEMAKLLGVETGEWED
jgi:hypothetical protein